MLGWIANLDFAGGTAVAPSTINLVDFVANIDQTVSFNAEIDQTVGFVAEIDQTVGFDANI